MPESRRYTLKELAAMLIGERPEELLDYAERENFVTLVSKSGQKFHILHATLVERQKTEDGGPETGGGRRGSEDVRRKTEERGRKRGGER